METSSYRLSLVIPVFNEGQSLPVLHQRLIDVLNTRSCLWNIWYVNDGSTDNTGSVIENIIREEPRVRLIELSRNFGHQSALTAGLDAARGDVVIVMDGDGQHPPEVIPRMLELYEAGFDVVFTKRTSTHGARLSKNVLASTFYWFLNLVSKVPVSSNSADFRLMSRPVVRALRRMKEYHRFLRGMVHWVGFKSATVEFAAPERIAGSTKYSFRKMLTLANHALFSFSLFPLKICVALGLALVLLSLAEGLYTAYLFLSPHRSELVPGWSSLMFFIVSIGGVQLTMLGVVGYYIGYIFEEVKRRPLYVVRRIVNAPGRRKP